MARLNYVKKARKAQGRCYKCSKPIAKGKPYVWWANRIGRYSRRLAVHAECRTLVRRSEYATTSDKLGRVYDAEDDCEVALQAATGVEEIAEALRTAAETISEVAQEYEESASNLPEGLQNSSTYDEIQEKADNLSSWASALEEKASELDDAEREDGDERSPEVWLDEQREEASNVLGNNPL